MRTFFVTLLLAGCAPSAAPDVAPPAAAPAVEQQPAPAPQEPAMPSSEAPRSGVANLPFSQGRTFATLDEYLAHRRNLSAIDIPYYEQVAPGVYRLTGGMRRLSPGEQPQTFTRAELAAEFGFDE